MKRLSILFALAAIFLFPVIASAAGSACTQTVTTTIQDTGFKAVRVLTFSCTGDDATGAWPASTAVSTSNMADLLGWYLISGSTKSGSTAPDANFTLTLSTTNEGDILGGAGKGPATKAAAAVSKFRPILDTAYLYPGLVPVTDTLTLAFPTNNTTASATTTLVFKFTK